jgi:hypothetical protein
MALTTWIHSKVLFGSGGQGDVVVRLINQAKPRAIPSPKKKVRRKLIALGMGGNVRGGFCLAFFMNLDSKTQFVYC